MRLFSTLAVKKALDDAIIDAFRRKSGIEIQAVFDPTSQLLTRIECGDHFDAIIGITDSFRELSHIIEQNSVTNVARTGIGVAVPPGAAIPDISTPKALANTILGAKSVAYSRTGASGVYFANLIERLGIAKEVNSRATILEKGFVAESLIDGRADVAVQQLSELLFVPDAIIAGPLPVELQHYTDFSVAFHAKTKLVKEAAAFIDFLGSDVAQKAYTETMLEVPAR